jgi:imidazolonepropionase-like amidohydrolase
MCRIHLAIGAAVFTAAACAPPVQDAAPVDLTAQAVPAEGLVITNARIITGTGQTIPNGSVVVQGDRIVEVAAGPADVPGALVIDAAGRTVLPGFIDGHRHIGADNQEWLDTEAEGAMRRFLETGFTTVHSMGDGEEAILALQRMTATGAIAGPRILTVGRAPLSAPAGGARGGGDPARTDVSRPPLRPTETAPAVPEAQTRARVQAIAAAGLDAVKTVIIITPDGPETETLRVIAGEAAAQGLRSVTHAVTVVDTLAAVEAGTHLLVHSPHIQMITAEQAQAVADSGIPMVSTLGIFVPFFDDANLPIFRDALPYPWETISSAGQGPVNARMLWEAGVTYAFGTDVSYDPAVTLEQELKSLFLTFSEQDILTIMTRNSAIAMAMEDEIGTLEAGKLADIVLVDGNPEQDIFDLLNVAVVLKEVRPVVDNR